MSPDNLIALAEKVRDLTTRYPKTWSTRELASEEYIAQGFLGGIQGKAVYAGLKALAESGYPGARRGLEKRVIRFGRPLNIQPWEWLAVAASDYEAWVASVHANPRKAVGAFATLEVRVEALEKLVAELLSR